jgi:hypothetical protein
LLKDAIFFELSVGRETVHLRQRVSPDRGFNLIC